MFLRYYYSVSRVKRLVFLCLLIVITLAFFYRFDVSVYSRETKYVPANFSILDLLSQQMAVNRKVLADHGLSLPASGGTYERILIITTFRSGSTFTGELLNHIPGVMYNFEPLLFFDKHILITINESLVEKPIDILYRMLQCDYGPLFREFRWLPTKKSELLRRNVAYRLCTEVENETYCQSAEFFSQACQHFPIQVAKSVRLPLKYVLPLLRRPELNLRVILLVRDPRGTMNSRRREEWCKGYCRSLEGLCKLLRSNYQPALEAAKEFPERFTVLRYEDMATNPEYVTEWLLQRLGIPMTPSVAEFVKTHTPAELHVTIPLFKKRGSRVTAWKEQLPWEYVQKIQSVCRDVFDMYGYVKVTDAGAINETQTFKTNWKLPAP